MKFRMPFIFVFIVFSLAISGCMSTPPAQVTPTPGTTGQASIAPGVEVTDYTKSVDYDTVLGVSWRVFGGTQGNINETAIIWGYNSSGPSISGYEAKTPAQTGTTPAQFNDSIPVTSNQTIYFRAYAVVDGNEVFSPEYLTAVVPPVSNTSEY